MKKTIMIIGRMNGISACIKAETEEDWIPMEKSDIGKVAEFMPQTISQVTIADDIGHVEMQLQLLESRPFDIRRRASR